MTTKYTTIERLLEMISRDFQWEFHVDYYEVAEWVGEAIDLLGLAQVYEEKVADGKEGNPARIEIESFRGILPCDLYKIKGVREYESKTTLRESTATFFNLNDEDYDTTPRVSEYTYKREGNYLKTNFEEGELEMVYWAFPVDEHGMPKIPEDMRILKAVQLYVAEKLAYRLYMSDKLAEKKYDRIDQEKSFRFKSAQSYAHTKSIDQMESWKNMVLRLITHPTAQGTGFRYISKPEEFHR